MSWGEAAYVSWLWHALLVHIGLWVRNEMYLRRCQRADVEPGQRMDVLERLVVMMTWPLSMVVIVPYWADCVERHERQLEEA